MSIKEVSDKMLDIQKILLFYLDNSENVEENFQNLKQLFVDHKIHDNKYDLILTFHLITKIANYHYRPPKFFDKIFTILQLFEEDIKNYFTFNEIFNIFKGNKRIILFLIESKLLILNEYMINKMATNKYHDMYYSSYFAPEIKSIMNDDFRQKHEYDGVLDKIEQKIPENFYENRRLGENESLLCKIIRKDSVEEFKSYVKENNIQLGSLIQSSIYETNRFLLYEQNKNDSIYYARSELTIIAYATFYRSNNIFQYLLDNEVELDESLWKFAVCGNNFEVIKILEEKKVEFSIYLFFDSLKCHHNDMTIYLKSYCDRIYFFYDAIKYHNYMFIEADKLNIVNDSFELLCKYDYPSFVKIIQQELNIDTYQILRFLSF